MKTQSRELVRHYQRVKTRHYNQGKLIAINLAEKKITQEQIEKELKNEDLSDLKALNLSLNNIEELNFPPLPSLEYLDLSENPNLHTITFKGNLPKLIRFDAYECSIENLHIPQAPLLKHLYLHHNKLTAIPLSKEYPYQALENLDLAFNSITKASLWAGFSKLRYLCFYQNKLQTLEFAEPLKELHTLHLRDNQLSGLPDTLKDFNKLTALYLHNNKLSQIPEAIVEEGEYSTSAKSVMDYFKAFEKGSKDNDRVKIIIVGNGRVGKTSMLRRIKGEGFDEQEVFTHGVKLVPLKKEHLPKVNTEELNAQVWDFGGQEIFYAIHQFFMSEEALYILAWTDESNVKPYLEREKDILPPTRWRSIDYWLEGIRHHAKESPIIMVQTHIDKLRLPVQQNYYAGEPYNAVCLDFSASREQDSGLTSLKEEITRKLNEDVPMFGQPFPLIYDNVIKEIRQQKGKNTITRKEFFQLARNEGIEEGGEESVLNYLRRTGIVIYFGDSEKLKDTIYINPNWLTGQVYKLINKKLEAKSGIFNRKYLDEVMDEIGENESRDTFKKYSSKEKDTFLALLKRFELIFQPNPRKETYVAPLYLPEELPENVKDVVEPEAEKLELAFSFRFPRFLPDNVMMNFISRYGPFSQKAYWRRGIYFVHEQGQKCMVKFVEHETSSPCLLVYTSQNPEAKILQKEICSAFVELSRNANAYVSLDADTYVSWQELIDNHKDGYTKIRDISHKQALNISQFAHLFVGIEGAHAPKEDPELPQEIANPEKQLNDKPAPIEYDYRDLLKLSYEDLSPENVEIIKEESLSLPQFKQDSGIQKVIFIASNPGNIGPIGTDEEFKKIMDEHDSGKQSGHFQVESRPAAEFDHLMNAFLAKPYILHFAGHGTKSQLVLANAINQAEKLHPEALTGITPLLKDHTQIVILNSCYSASIAKMISKYGIFVIGSRYALEDDMAIMFSQGFYKAIFSGANIMESFRMGRARVTQFKGQVPRILEMWYNGKRVKLEDGQ